MVVGVCGIAEGSVLDPAGQPLRRCARLSSGRRARREGSRGPRDSRGAGAGAGVLRVAAHLEQLGAPERRAHAPASVIIHILPHSAQQDYHILQYVVICGNPGL